MVISDNGASAEGGPTRLGQREHVLQQRPRRPRAEPGGHRRPRRAEVLQPLLLGLDACRQHAVPALEARDLPRRRRPTRSSSTGRRASRPRARSATQYRPRHRHGADRAGRARHRAADARSAASPSRRSRASASRTPSTTPRRRASTRPSTSRCSATARSITTAGARSARCPAPRSPRPGVCFGMPTLTEDKLRELDAKGWELYHLDEGLRRDQQPRRRRTATKLIEMIAHLVRRGRQVQRAAARQPRHAALRRRAAAAHGGPRRPTSTIRAPRWCLRTSRPSSSTGRTASPRRSRSRRAAPKACSICHGGNVGGYTLFVQGQQAPLRPQLRRARRNSTSSLEHRRSGGQGRAALRVRADRQARPGQGQGGARQGPALHQRQARRAR